MTKRPLRHVGQSSQVAVSQQEFAKIATAANLLVCFCYFSCFAVGFVFDSFDLFDVFIGLGNYFQVN